MGNPSDFLPRTAWSAAGSVSPSPGLAGLVRCNYPPRPGGNLQFHPINRQQSYYRAFFSRLQAFSAPVFTFFFAFFHVFASANRRFARLSMFCYVNASGRIASGSAARLSPLGGPAPPPLPALFPHLGHGITARRKMLCAAARFAPLVKFPRDGVAAAPPRKALLQPLHVSRTYSRISLTGQFRIKQSVSIVFVLIASPCFIR